MNNQLILRVYHAKNPISILCPCRNFSSYWLFDCSFFRYSFHIFFLAAKAILFKCDVKWYSLIYFRSNQKFDAKLARRRKCTPYSNQFIFLMLIFDWGCIWAKSACPTVVQLYGFFKAITLAQWVNFSQNLQCL